jgi:hypothetical protein
MSDFSQAKKVVRSARVRVRGKMICFTIAVFYAIIMVKYKILGTE